MRKRRRLANKMTIMVCAVLIAVSAFFYAPMEVNAEELVFSSNNTLYTNHDDTAGLFAQSNTFDFYTGDIDSEQYYSLDIGLNFDIVTDIDVMLRHVTLKYGSNVYLFNNTSVGGVSGYSSTFSQTSNIRVVAYGRWLKNTKLNFYGRIFANDVSKTEINYNLNIDYEIKSITPLTGEQSASYQQGYNAGYSAGEEAGESNGYSSGYSDGYEAGEQSGYDSGFQAGSDSVDTQSYYDAGYQAGYDAGYASGYDTGYDTGYDAGWSAYESQMDKWGADTSDYPLLLFDKPLISRVFSVTVKSSIPTRYSDFAEWTSDLNFNPNHTYRFNVVLNPTEYNEGSTDIYFMNSDIFYFNIGGIKYHISNFSGSNVNTFFVPGDCMSSAFSFSWEPLLAVMGDTFESGSAYCYYDLNYQIFDMGPSGDTQNHIANQTDQLTHGYDDSKGNTVNSELSTGLNEFETAENSLFATAATGMNDFTFFDFESVPAMITGISFIGSIMGSWFNQAGGASGVGIVLSILFSVILVAMVLGLYRWYQSRGGKN